MLTTARSVFYSSLSRIFKEGSRGKRKSVDRALAIMQQLRGSLNKEEGANIAKDLERLYDYIMTRISEGSRKLDTRPSMKLFVC